MTVKITRSPRAPALDLGEAIKKAQMMLKVQSKQSVPSDVAAKHMGYSGINNGTAARAMGALKAFGLVVSNAKGDIAVSPDVEEYTYSPDQERKNQIVDRWLKAPRIYADLIADSEDISPSDEVLKYRLIKAGFAPAAADDCAKNFKASVAFARYYERKQDRRAEPEERAVIEDVGTPTPTAHVAPQAAAHANVGTPTVTQVQPQEGVDRIPVRLKNGRRAWIEVPTPFFEADKELLKKHIDLILTDDAEE